MGFLSNRLKPVQKTQGITNGTSGGIGQQQATALCDISAQVQQYQQFLGEQLRQSADCSTLFVTIHSLSLYKCMWQKWDVMIGLTREVPVIICSLCCCVLCRGIKAAAWLCGHWSPRSNSARWDPFRTPQGLSDSLQRTLWGRQSWTTAAHTHYYNRSLMYLSKTCSNNRQLSGVQVEVNLLYNTYILKDQFNQKWKLRSHSIYLPPCH